MSQVHPGQSTQFVILLEARKRLESVRPCAHSLTRRPQGQPEELLDASHTTSTRLLVPDSVRSRRDLVRLSTLLRPVCLFVLVWEKRFHVICRRWLALLCVSSPSLWPVSRLLGLGPPLVRSRSPARWLPASLLSALGCPPPLSLSPSLLGCCRPPLHACGLFIPACHRLSTGLAHCRPYPPSTHGAHMTLL